jgi:nucleoside 2-deoxyribosyltransferase
MILREFASAKLDPGPELRVIMDQAMEGLAASAPGPGGIEAFDIDVVEVLSPASEEVLAEYRDEAALDSVRVRPADVLTLGPAIRFDYVHGLATPAIVPAPATLPAPSVLDARGPLVIRFGMLEATARVTADTCVYDSESAFAPEIFAANGSVARRLAIVGNRGEIAAMGRDRDPVQAARNLLADGAEVVVVKAGAAGASVVTSDLQTVPARLTTNVWPIGSGDVFAAAFTAAWAVDGLDPADAANFASYAVADYVETMSLPVSTGLKHKFPDRAAVVAKGGKVYLAGPFFSMAQRWLVDEARRALTELGMQVFSPLHEIGRGPAHEVAPADIRALTECDTVFALLDGLDSGTLFEVGYARALDLPVYGFAQITPEEDLKMVAGSGCRLFSDFVTGLHHCAWGA